MSLVGTSDSMPRERALAPACQTFHFFTELPAELRLKIWEYNLPESRVVTVQCGNRSASLLPDWSACPQQTMVPAWVDGRNQTCPFSSSPPPRPWCTSPAAIPANLHACHESRVEALRRYARMFGIARQLGHVYFDAIRDVLYFGPRPGYMASEAQLRTLLALADPDELQRVQRVAVNEALFWEAAGEIEWETLSPSPGPSSPAFQLATNTTVDMLHLLRTRLPSLRELILVPRDEVPGPDIEAALVPLTDRCSIFTRHPHAATAVAYLGLQVQEAMRRMRTTTPDWSPPPWSILALSGAATSHLLPRQHYHHQPISQPLDSPPAYGSRPVNGTCSAAYLESGQGRPPVVQPVIHYRRQRLPSLAAAFPYGSRGAVLPPAVASSFSRVSQTGAHFMMQFRDLDE